MAFRTPGSYPPEVPSQSPAGSHSSAHQMSARNCTEVPLPEMYDQADAGAASNLPPGIWICSDVPEPSAFYHKCPAPLLPIVPALHSVKRLHPVTILHFVTGLQLVTALYSVILLYSVIVAYFVLLILSAAGADVPVALCFWRQPLLPPAVSDF